VAPASPEFSVIVPTFGRPAFLADAVGSVLRQTVTDFECIVVDDASPDGPVLPDDPRVRVVRREDNGGPPAARNTGIAAATGRYLAFLDDDDIWLPNRLAVAADAHRRAPVAICWQSTLDSHDKPSGRLFEGDVRDTVLDEMIPHLGATSIERLVAPQFDQRYEASDDVEWWLRVAQELPVATNTEVCLLYRVHDAPRTRTSQRNRLNNAEMLLEQYDEWFRTHPRAKAFRLKRMGLSALRVDDRRLARRCFTGSLRLRPEPRTAWHALRTLTPHRSTARA
jgi:glycosyltransferase involved in cell wall biosynthesis